jgi:hypothetical protein
LGLFHFIVETVLGADWVAHVASRALDGKDDYKELDPASLARKDPGQRTAYLRGNRQLLLEMFVSRAVDNFQIYLIDLIRTVLRSRPQMLSTSKQSLSLEEVLRHDSIDSLIHQIVERKVNSLSYDGFAELERWCQDRGIPIAIDDQARIVVIEFIATRNIIAHNRGIVDDTYVRSVANSRFEVGNSRQLEVDDFFSALNVLQRVVCTTDTEAVHKFNLDVVDVLDKATVPGDGRGLDAFTT